MDRREAIERAVGYADEGVLCVETVFKALTDMYGIDSDLIPKVASCLAVGVARTSHICGALTGAILGLGLWFGRNESVEGDRKPYWYSRRFICGWLELYLETNCSLLLGVDLDITPRGTRGLLPRICGIKNVRNTSGTPSDWRMISLNVKASTPWARSNSASVSESFLPS